MNLKSISLLVSLLALAKSVILENVENEFVVVSTTQRSSEKQADDRTVNNSHRLDKVELQIQQILKSLEDMKLTNCLEANRFQNQTIQKILDSNKEIQKTLEEIKLTNRQVSQNIIFRNCQDAKEKGFNVSQVYRIHPRLSSIPFNVWCDMETRGGGWTYLLNRYDGSQNFDLKWIDYRNGFGNPAKEFWLGLEYQHQLTTSEDNELLVELVDWDNKTVYAHYTGFKIGNEPEGYPIKVLKGYSGDAGDSFSYHFGMKFTTEDKDQDKFSGNCASEGWGGWWYNSCKWAKLTGTYYHWEGKFSGGIHWVNFHSAHYSLKEARMMVKPRKL